MEVLCVLSFYKYFMYLFLKRGKENQRERNIDMREKHPARDQPGTETTTQACTLTGNRTSDLSLCGMTPNQATGVRAVYLLSAQKIYCNRRLFCTELKLS